MTFSSLDSSLLLVRKADSNTILVRAGSQHALGDQSGTRLSYHYRSWRSGIDDGNKTIGRLMYFMYLVISPLVLRAGCGI